MSQSREQFGVFPPFAPANLPAIEKLIGQDALRLAQPALAVAAFAYTYGRNKTYSRTAARTELERVDRALASIERISRLTSATRAVLETTFDRGAVLAGEPFVNGWQSLQEAISECRRARRLIQIARRKFKHTPQMILTYGVGAALSVAGVPLAKNRDGIFAQVLSKVWEAVEPNGGPEDVFPYVQKVADEIRQRDPNLNPPKGRRRSSAK